MTDSLGEDETLYSPILDLENEDLSDWEGQDICDNCGNFAPKLKLEDGQLICEDCINE